MLHADSLGKRSLRRVRAACGGGSGRLRAPPAGNPTTQAAAKTLADVKTWLSAQQLGARSGSTSAFPGVPGRVGSPAPMQQARTGKLLPFHRAETLLDAACACMAQCCVWRKAPSKHTVMSPQHPGR